MALLRGSEAIVAYQIACPSDSLDDLSGAEKSDFEFGSIGILRMPIRVDKIMVYASLAPSNSAARRLLKAGAVDVDENRTTETEATVLMREDNPSFVLRVGRQQKRIKFVD